MSLTRQRVGSVVIASLAALAVAAPGAKAASKNLSGELQCPPGDKVTGIWLKGSESGWHGADNPGPYYPYVGQYKMRAVKGEQVEAWLRCAVSGESYHRFTVGNGSKRHICRGYGGWNDFCASVGLGSCGLKLVVQKNLFKFLLCSKKYVS